MVSSFTEGRHPGDFILTESPGSLSRENATIDNSQTVLVGSVLARQSSGLWCLYNGDGSSGAETAAGIAIYPCVTGTGDNAEIAVISWGAEVIASMLDWGDQDTSDIAEGVADFRSIGIRLR